MIKKQHKKETKIDNSLSLGLEIGVVSPPSGGPSGPALLMETGDYLLLETGDYILLEA